MNPRAVLLAVSVTLAVGLAVTTGWLLVHQDTRIGKQEDVTSSLHRQTDRLDRIAKQQRRNTRRIQRLLHLDRASRPRRRGAEPARPSRPRRSSSSRRSTAASPVVRPTVTALASPVTAHPRPPRPTNAARPAPTSTSVAADPTPAATPVPTRAPVGATLPLPVQVCTDLLRVNC